jgi:hypothetical protein
MPIPTTAKAARSNTTRPAMPSMQPPATTALDRYRAGTVIDPAAAARFSGHHARKTTNAAGAAG